MSKVVQLNLGTTVEPEDLEVAELLFELKKFELEAKTNCLYLDWDKIWKIVSEIEAKSVNIKTGEEFTKIKGRLESFYKKYESMYLYLKMF